MEYRVIYRRNGAKTGTDHRTAASAERTARKIAAESGVTHVVWGRA